MSDRPFHHGNLRAVMLAEAQATLRTEGADALSLRQLARRAGVSHAAPRRHFSDRQALIDALVAEGFRRLTAEMQAATGDAATREDRLLTAAHAYVRFAIGEPALLELMFAMKNLEPRGAAHQPAESFFAAMTDLIGRETPGEEPRPEDPDTRQLLLVATLQGIAALVISGRVDAGRVDALVSSAISVFVGP